MQHMPWPPAALRKEQLTAVRLCCADELFSNGQQSIERRIYFGAEQSKQLSTNDPAVFDLDAVVIIWAERWSQIHGIRPIIRRQLATYIGRCVNKSKLLLYVQRMVSEQRQIGLWSCLLQQIRSEHFEIIDPVSTSTQVMWRMLKYTSKQ